MVSNFNDGIFRSDSGEIIEIKIYDGVMHYRYQDETEFTQLRGLDDGWAWDDGISISTLENDVLISRD